MWFSLFPQIKFSTLRKFSLLLLCVMSLYGMMTLGCGKSSSRSISRGAAETSRAVTLLKHYDEALHRSLEENKPLLLFFSTDQCVYSDRMRSQLIKDESMKKLLSQFICVEVNAAELPQLCREYEVREFPTIQFVDAGGLRLSRLIGEQQPTTFVLQMHGVLQSVAGRRQIAAQSETPAIRTM